MTNPRKKDTGITWNVAKRKDSDKIIMVLTIKAGIRKELGWSLGDEIDMQVTPTKALVLKKVS